MIRKDRDDPGICVEFKRPTRLSYNAIRKNIRKAAFQLDSEGGGEVVIDGRDIGLTEAVARKYYSDAVTEASRKSEPQPHAVHFILGNGSMLTIQRA